MVQPDQMLDVSHTGICLQSQLLENMRHHSSPNFLVAMEGPATAFMISLTLWFSDVMKESGPSKPVGFVRCLIPGHFDEIVNDLQGVIKIVFVFLPVFLLNTLQSDQLGENYLEYSGVE